MVRSELLRVFVYGDASEIPVPVRKKNRLAVGYEKNIMGLDSYIPFKKLNLLELCLYICTGY